MTDTAADPITDRLCAELRARFDRGVQKYGVTLDAANLTPAQILQHAKEEALDLTAYLQKLIDSGAAADRIAAAPRAWAVKTAAGIEPGYTSELQHFHSFSAWAKDQFGDDVKIVRVALVEVEGEG